MFILAVVKYKFLIGLSVHLYAAGKNDGNRSSRKNVTGFTDHIYASQNPQTIVISAISIPHYTLNLFTVTEM